jgi:hypothetical protein
VTLFDRAVAWLARRRGHPAPDGAAAFRAEARAAARTGDRATVEALIRWPAEPGWHGADVELELEMLEGRLAVLALEDRARAGALPWVETQHKAVAGETCHFIAPASVATDTGETGGTLFLTARRLRFVGGGGWSVAWSALRDVRDADRDLIVTTVTGRETRFRCNSYADARVACRLAQVLEGGARVQGQRDAESRT